MKKTYNLKELYDRETYLEKYIRLTVGEGAGFKDLLFQELLLGLCSGMPGIIGFGIRNKAYPFFFKGFSKQTFIGKHVMFRCPLNIRLLGQVIIDDFAQLIATSRKKNAIEIGAGSFLRSFAMLNSGPPDGYIKIGDNCSIGQGALLYGNGGLRIGNNVMIAGQSAIIASSHIYEKTSIPMVDQGYIAEGITIKDNVWIGSGAKILDGVIIGQGAIVGANAVVNKSIQPYQHVAGVPARSIPSKDSQFNEKDH